MKINTLILFLALVLITIYGRKLEVNRKHRHKVKVNRILQVPIGANIVWGTLGGDLVTQSSPGEYWTRISGNCVFLDRYPQANGGLLYCLSSKNEIYRKDGTTGDWVQIPGSLSYLKISRYDKTVWGINTNNNVFWLKDGSSSLAQVDGIMGYLDVSPLDGAVWAINYANLVYYRPGISGNWTEISGLKLKYLRVMSNGNVIGICTNSSVYLKNDKDSPWQKLGGDFGFSFIDGDSNGTIWAIKSDNTLWRRPYNGSWRQWFTPFYTMTLNVLENGGVYAVTNNPANPVFYLTSDTFIPISSSVLVYNFCGIINRNIYLVFLLKRP